MENKKVVILGGGTVSYIRNHLALAAPAYGTTARQLEELCLGHSGKLDVELVLTRMALGTAFQFSYEGSSLKHNVLTNNLETPRDVDTYVDTLVKDLSVKIVFFNVAMVDYFANSVSGGAWDSMEVGKYEKRLSTRDDPKTIVYMTAQEKVIQKIRKTRKDIFLVGFKTTCGATEQEQFTAGLNLLKEASCNLVLANDTKTRFNMVITPEEAAYHRGTGRSAALKGLVEMAYLRSHLTFTRSTVVSGEPVAWESDLVPSSLRAIVNYCIEAGAYKPFRGSTVGHFAVKVDERTFLTSQRKTNFNDLHRIGLVKVTTDGPDSVLAWGAKPSVGGQSQRIVFETHKDMDCIVHFHCPLKENHQHNVPVVSQREYECGSHQCGENTAKGLAEFKMGKHIGLAVMLDQHGPNIVFNRNIDPRAVIEFIESNFDLRGKTGGYMV